MTIKKELFSAALSGLALLFLVSCGGGEGGCTEAATKVLTSSEITALTSSQMAQLRDVEIVAMGANFHLLSDANLSVLAEGVSNINPMCKPHVSQLNAITPDQIASLTTHQVRMLGTAGNAGVAKLNKLNLDTFDRLVSDTSQVAAITASEYAALGSKYFTRIVLNIQYLSNAVLMSFSETYTATPTNTVSMIEALTPNQVDTLSTAQIALIGTDGGALPKYRFMGRPSYQRMAQRSANVARITAAEVVLLNTNQIIDLGTNIASLSDATLQNLKYTYTATPTTPHSQIGSITRAQIQAFSRAQIMIIAGINSNHGLASLSDNAFSGLGATQVDQLTSQNLDSVTASQLSGLSETTLAAIPLATRQSVTTAQKSLLSAAQLVYFP